MTSEGSSWVFEELETSLLPERMILVRVLIAKIKDRAALAQLLRDVSIRGGQEGWNCVSWVQEGIEKVTLNNVLGTKVTEWQVIRDAAMSYCQQKKDQHRFDGQGHFDTSQVPTFDLIQGKETTV